MGTKTVVNKSIQDMLYKFYRQYPLQPSTFSGCCVRGCKDYSRGGNKCIKHLEQELASLVGEDLALRFSEALAYQNDLIWDMNDVVGDKL